MAKKPMQPRRYRKIRLVFSRLDSLICVSKIRSTSFYIQKSTLLLRRVLYFTWIKSDYSLASKARKHPAGIQSQLFSTQII